MTTYVEQLWGKDALKSKHDAEYIDRSDLEAFADCPHQGQLRKQHEGEFETHEPLPEAGEIVHRIAEEAIKLCDYNLQQAADMIAEELFKALGRTDLQPDVIRAGRNLANEIRRFGGNKIMLCEEQISRSILPETKERGELIVTTKPDLVLATTKEDTIIVLDYKTGYKQRTNAEAQNAFQTAVLCWILKGMFPVVNTIHFWYLETRTHSRAYAKIIFDQLVGKEVTQEMALETRILETAKHYVDGCDEAWPSPAKCAMCPMIQWCTDFGAIPGIPELADDPKNYLDIYIRLAARLDEMLKAMKAYVKNGRVIYGTKERFAWEPKPKFSPKLFANTNGKEDE